MRALGDPARLPGMARFGIRPDNALGLSVPQIRSIARGLGKDQSLAEELWNTGIHDARILASLVGDPLHISRSTMDRWARDFASWDVCDSCCGNLFDRTPFAWDKIRKWAGSDREFVRRASFATLSYVGVPDKKAADGLFLEALPLVEQYAFDNRNFVRKAVNWALRSIGKRNAVLMRAALECAGRVREQNTAAARWIASDAIRELARRG